MTGPSATPLPGDPGRFLTVVVALWGAAIFIPRYPARRTGGKGGGRSMGVSLRAYSAPDYWRLYYGVSLDGLRGECSTRKQVFEIRGHADICEDTTAIITW